VTQQARYAPCLSLLAEDADYLRRASAPAYWALAPHYVGQFNETSCSVATATMLLNAARGSAGLAPGERLVEQQALLARMADPVWTAGCGGNEGHGVNLTQLRDLLARAGALYGLTGRIEAEPVLAAEDAGDGFRAALCTAELAPGRLLAVNFHAGGVYGHGDYGHFSPLGAYDAGRDRVLVLDVDRGSFEPFWAPVGVMLAGMATRSPIGDQPRGYLVVTLSPATRI
jgi:hypothetical protein